jgi:hypothetical protein
MLKDFDDGVSWFRIELKKGRRCEKEVKTSLVTTPSRQSIHFYNIADKITQNRRPKSLVAKKVGWN